MSLNSLSFPRRVLCSVGLQRFHIPEWVMLLGGFISYLRTGTTPDSAYHKLIDLFCKTGGWSNDFLHSLIKLWRRPYKLPSAQGILGQLTETDLMTVTQQLSEKGYYVFPTKLSSELCDQLLAYALTTPSQPNGTGVSSAACLYDRNRPCDIKYDFSEQDLLTNKSIQALVGDLSLLSVAQAYLGSQPLLDAVSMWWSTAFVKEASSQAAQLYHFDMDRIKWLKFFIYLTDVDTHNGPHCFVSGSHKQKGQPRTLLQKGYARITDEEMAQHYPREALIEFTGPRGTIIAEDTRGFHKGKVLEKGDRLVLELEFCDSLFGGVYSRPYLPAELVSSTEQVIRMYPRVYSKYRSRAAC